MHDQALCERVATNGHEAPEHDADDRAAHSRRTVLKRAAIGLAAVGGAAAVVGRVEAASAGTARSDVLDFIVTQEQFGVTFLKEAIRRAPGTPSATFLPVLKAAATTEYDHVRALEDRLGAKPLTTRYWIPDAAFGGGGPGLFASLEAVEEIELSMYLIGVTAQVRKRNPFGARLLAEAMATESEHRVLARSAQAQLGAPTQVANNISFAPYYLRTIPEVQAALEKLGVGYDKQNATPGNFYDYPGDPIAGGFGSSQIVRFPA